MTVFSLRSIMTVFPMKVYNDSVSLEGLLVPSCNKMSRHNANWLQSMTEIELI